ncbi:MAG: GNAT family N-acetyltransferase [Anaerolineae bacterium]|nr:GNAT family N-acetyltransferase [Anaerolineae bacterium]
MISGNDEITTRKATEADIDMIKILADSHRQELGFVRRPALLEAIKRNEVLVAQNSHQIIGFVEYHCRRDEQATLYHIAVETDYQSQGIGKILINALCAEAARVGKTFVCIKCPADLPANEFYKNIGGQLMTVEPGKRRSLSVWRLML